MLACAICGHFPNYVCLCNLYFPDGCPGLCYGNGRCTLDQNGWHCVCQVGWTGMGCDIVMEMVCGDNLDNDGGTVHAFGMPYNRQIYSVVPFQWPVFTIFSLPPLPFLIEISCNSLSTVRPFIPVESCSTSVHQTGWLNL